MIRSSKPSANTLEISCYGFLLYCIYVIAIVFAEYFSLFEYLSNARIPSILALGLFTFSFILIGIVFRRQVTIVNVQYNFIFYIVLTILLLFSVLKCIYPDTAYDTLHYHLIAQNPQMTNFFFSHFAKGNFQVWGFRLGDRLFYLFRLLLGYRLGTLLNTFVLMISYIQLYKFLLLIQNRPKLSALWAGFIVTSFECLLMLGIYYVDILALPIGLEVIRQLWNVSKTSSVTSKNITFFALLNGIWFAMKMTNIVYVVPCVILYIILIRKNLTVKNFLLSVCFAALPCTVYIIYNWCATGNPVFPYFNSLFLSDFFLHSSFKDTKWGPITLLEKLLWPFYMVFFPNYRQSELPNYNQFLSILGICGILYLFISKIRVGFSQKRISVTPCDILCTIFSISALAWSFSTGYNRYFIFGILLLGILAFTFVTTFRCPKIAMFAICTILSYQSISNFHSITTGYEWSWNKWDAQTIASNMKQLFHDKTSLKQQQSSSDIEMFYLTDSMYCGVADAISPNTYTYNANYYLWLDDLQTMEQAFNSHSYAFSTGKVYDIHKRLMTELEQYIATLNKHNMFIYDVTEYSGDMGTYELFQLTNDTSLLNESYLSGSTVQLTLSQDSQNASLSFLCGRIYPWKTSPTYFVSIYLSDGNSRKLVTQITVDNLQIQEHVLDLGEIKKNSILEFSFCDAEGNELQADNMNPVFMINPQVHY